MCKQRQQIQDNPGGPMFERSVFHNRNHGTAEQRLWRAVIAKTLEEWMNGPLRFSRIAEEFLFYDNKDFVSVCSSAGQAIPHKPQGPSPAAKEFHNPWSNIYPEKSNGGKRNFDFSVILCESL